MKNKKSKLIKGMFFSALVLSTVAVADIPFISSVPKAHAETMTGAQYVLNNWNNYPNINHSNFDAGWGVNGDVLYTSKNIHWTGFWNATEKEATDRTFEMNLRLNQNHLDPFGWTFRHRELSPNTFSFYAVEISPYHNEITLAKINSWTPSQYDPVHGGPLYHGTISSADGSYSNYGGGDRQAGRLSNVNGQVLSYAPISWSYYNWHSLKIENIGNRIKVWYDGQLKIDYTDNSNPLTYGGYGPYTASQYTAEFKNIYINGSSFLNVPPQLTVSSPTANSQYIAGNSMYLSGTIHDPDNRGTMSVKYSIDNGAEQTLTTKTSNSNPQSYGGNISLPSNLSIGTHTLQVWGTDSENGFSPKQNITFTIKDTISPTLSLSKSTSGWTNQGVTITANASDNHSIKRIKLPNGNYVNGSTASYVVNENGTYTFEAEDMAGNKVSQSINVSNKDNGLPTVSNAYMENLTKNGYDVVVTGVSDDASGVNRVQFPTWTEANGQDDLASSWTTNNAVKGTNEGNGKWRFHVDKSAHNNEYGNYITHVYVFDNAGNSQMVKDIRAFLDNQAPSVTVTSPTSGWTTANVVLNVNASDVGSGVKRIKLPNGNYVNGSTASFVVNENGSYTFVAEDEMGNTTSKTFNVTNLDKTKPTVSHSLNTTALTTGSVRVTVNASDNQSGVSGIVDVEKMVHGLTGEYRQHVIPSGTVPPINKGDIKFTRIDDDINFNWGSGTPDSRISAEGFNVTWTGYIKSPVTGDVTFETNTDDGAILTIGDNTIIDKWRQQSPTKWNGTVHLEEGKWYPIRMEYYENSGGATAQLKWKYAGMSDFEIVPNSVLYTGGKTNGSTLAKSVEKNGLYHFFAEDNVGNIQEHQVTISNLTFKPELTATPVPAEDYVKLNWTMDDAWQGYKYMIYKKKSSETNYQSIPAKSNVKVLNVYPRTTSTTTFTNWKGESHTVPISASIKKWMEQPNAENPKGYGQGLIEVDTVSIPEFNANPNAYLKNPDGSWKYDVVFEGALDGNGFRLEDDYSQQAVNALEEWIADGQGYLSGHDTVMYPMIWNTNTNQLRDDMNIKVRTLDSEANGIGSIGGSTGTVTVKIKNKGFLTNYPWNIGDINTLLTVPASHNSGQVTYGNVWLDYTNFSGRMTDINGEGQVNFYLTTWNNTAMIQTGHLNGQATPDEQKVLANTLFYLAQKTQSTTWDDHTSQDVDAPNKPTIQSVVADGLTDKVKVDFTAVSDNGSTYNYYVEATGQQNGAKTTSDVETATVTTGLDGYSIVVDNNPTTIPDRTIETKNDSFTLSKNIDSNFYVHVVAIDKVGNMSDVSHYHYVDSGAPNLDVVADKTAWTNGNVILTATASDKETAIKRIKLPDGTWINGANATYTATQNGTYTFIAEDLVGNQTTKTISVSNIDKSAPSSPSISNNQNWVNATSVAVSIQAGTDSLSGVNRVEYKVEGATVKGWTKYTGTFHISNEGETNIIARTIDNVGQISGQDTSYVRIDRSVPHNTGITIKVKP